MGLSGGIHTSPADTLLTTRAQQYLSAGPADAVDLIAHVCNLPGPPRTVAEHLAAAMFAGRTDFEKGIDGKWRIAQPPVISRSSSSPGFGEPALDRIDKLSYVVVDVETTGTSAMFGDRITEVAAVVVRDGAIVDVFETLVNPQRPIPYFVTALTHITWDMVKDAPTFEQVAPRLMSALGGHVFTAHNAKFDWRFVSTEILRATGNRIQGRQLCTVKLAKRLLPQLHRRSLDHLAHHYGVTIRGRHRAGGDALATAECLVKMLHHANDAGLHTWADLQRFAAARAPRKKRSKSAMPGPAVNDLTA
ncbi:MAG TPA: 3'-5' exonuclease [Gemmatimonadaceae bacterium]|nr:3'-5' exonuclease [Gemmatimonadaceae bacterium]